MRLLFLISQESIILEALILITLLQEVRGLRKMEFGKKVQELIFLTHSKKNSGKSQLLQKI